MILGVVGGDPAPGGVLLGERDRFLVPVGEPRAVSFFLRSLFVAHKWRERLARALGQWAPVWAGRRLLRSSWTLQRPGGSTPGGAPPPAPWNAGVEMASRALETEDLFAGTPLETRRPSHFILLRDAGPAAGAVVFLFASGDARPAAVLKVRRRGTGGSLQREREALDFLAGRLPDPHRATVPAPLAFRTLGDAEALLLGFVPGRSAYVEMQGSLWPRRAARRHLDNAAAWLGAFHGATRQGRRFSVDGAEPALRAALGGGGIPAWFEELARLVTRSPLPLAAGQGDFWARNLLLTEGDIRPRGTPALPSVVDFEHFREEAPPFEDLFDFALTYGLNFPWAGGRRSPPEEAFSRTFVRDNEVSRAVRRYILRYCAETGIAAGLLPGLFRLYLLTRLPRAGRGRAGDEELWLRCHETLERADRSVFSG